MSSLKRTSPWLLAGLLQLLALWAPADAHAQNLTTDVAISIDRFLYDLHADCGGGFDVPRQYVEWSMIQGSTVVASRTPILGDSGVGPVIADPRRPYQDCSIWAISSSLFFWNNVQNVTLSGTFASNGGPIVVEIKMYDEDPSGLFGTNDDDHLDLTQAAGDDVRFAIDPETRIVTSLAGLPGDRFCNTPAPSCSDNEGQWCGACNEGQPCCDSGDPDRSRGYAFRGDGQGAGVAWTVRTTRRLCTARRDVDSDRDGLLDDWETAGRDVDCDGTVDLPFNTWGANPLHKDLFVEYDACQGEPISRASVQNLKAMFAAAPVDAMGWPNPDNLPGINVWVDTGTLIDPRADEGVSTCGDGLDNDGDGNLDANDPDCRIGPQEAVGSCSDGIDNDNDGIVDRGFPPFLPGGPCSPVDANNANILRVEGHYGTTCTDGADNDNDGRVDENCRVGDDLGGGNVATNCPAHAIPFITADFFTVKNANFDPMRHGMFRYALRAAEPGDQAMEDGVPGACNDLDPMGNPRDNGGVGFDQTDSACLAAREGPGAFGSADCFDGVNNDDDNGDGVIDAADTLFDDMDPDCNAALENGAVGGTVGSCYDMTDNIGDGANGADPDCEQWGGWNDGYDNVLVLMDDTGLVLTHELGHSLGLSHGGNDGFNFKPNYLSIMNYLYRPGLARDRDAMAEDFSGMREDGAAPGSCTDQLDNGNDGFIDALDPNCRGTCTDLANADDDGDGAPNSLDVDCRGLDSDLDNAPEFTQMDFSRSLISPASGQRTTLVGPLFESQTVEANVFSVIDTSIPPDGRQDLWVDAVHQLIVRRYLPTAREGGAAAANTCSDGMDNDGNGVADHFDFANCRGPQLFLTRAGERSGGSVLPVGFDWNNDGDVADILDIDMDDDGDLLNAFLQGSSEGIGAPAGSCTNMADDNPTSGFSPIDNDDSFCAHHDHDDWTALRAKTFVRNLPIPLPRDFVPEITTVESLQRLRAARTADLVIASNAPRFVPNSSGVVVLQLEVENVEPTEAFGPVVVTLEGLPDDAVVSSGSTYCWRERGDTLCLRTRVAGHEIWPLTLSIEADPCSWRSTTVTAKVQHANGTELNPQDNEIAIAIGGAGIWPQWRQCASHWGDSNLTGPATLGSAAVLWTGTPVLNTPVIDDAGAIYIADSLGFVRKILPNGTTVWNRLLLGVVKAGPALTPSGTIVVATADGRIQGLSQQTGAPVWDYFTGAVVYGSIVVAGDRLYVVTSLGLGLADSLIAFSIDGGFLWSRPMGGPVVATPTVGDDGTIYVSVDAGLFSSAKLVAVAPTNSERWSRPLNGNAKDSPVQRGGRVYVGTSTKRVYAFDIVTGVQQWMYTVPCSLLEACGIAGSPAVLDNSQLAVGVAGGRIHVIRDAGASAVLVRSINATGLLLGGPRDSMVVGDNGIAYVGNKSAQLRAINLQTGAQVSLVTMLGNAVGAVALDGQGRLIVGTSLGFVYRY